MTNIPDSKQEAPQSCKWCDKGDRPNFLDQDGTLVSITGEDGILCHAHEEYWWPCLRFGVELRSSRASVAAVEGDAFTEDPPTKQGWYWHWNGDKDCAPVPISVLIHGAGDRKCFVSMGQLGLTRAIECDEYGGWWMPLHPPAAATTSPETPVGDSTSDTEREACEEGQAATENTPDS